MSDFIIKTSNFKNIRNVTNPVSISLYPPNWYEGDKLTCLAPNEKLLRDKKNKLISEEEYTVRYYEEILSNLNPFVIYNQLKNTYDKECTLLCYEDKNQFCHRQLVANWLSNNLEIEVMEVE